VNPSTNEPAVVLTVPATAEQLALLRTLVGYYAGRERFTLDQIDDLKMAVDEAGVQLLRRIMGDVVRLELLRVPPGVVVRVVADVEVGGRLIDPDSFSWMILQALSDKVDVEQDGSRVAVVLEKHHLGDADPRAATDDAAAGGRVEG
jgi:serine/threonine-protein kinase RsbW